MNNRLFLSLVLLTNVGVAINAAPAKNSFLRPATVESSDSGYSIGGAIDGVIGFLYLDSLVRRGADLFTFWGWASELNRAKYPQVYAAVGAACERFDVPMPDLYVINNSNTNAELWAGKINAVVYGWSPRYAAITITQDTLDLLTQDELDAYLTQAVARIKNRSARLYNVLNYGFRCSPLLAALQTLPSTGLVADDDGKIHAVTVPGRSLFMAALISLAGQAWLRTKIEDADKIAANHLRKPDALAKAIEKENEHASLPYKLGSKVILSLFNNWPTAVERLETVEKVRKQRKD